VFSVSPWRECLQNPSLALRALIRADAKANQSPERKRVGLSGTLNTYRIG